MMAAMESEWMIHVWTEFSGICKDSSQVAACSIATSSPSVIGVWSGILPVWWWFSSLHTKAQPVGPEGVELASV